MILMIRNIIHPMHLLCFQKKYRNLRIVEKKTAMFHIGCNPLLMTRQSLRKHGTELGMATKWPNQPLQPIARPWRAPAA